MSGFQKIKRTTSLFSSLLSLGILVGMFAYLWHVRLREFMLFDTFFRRGDFLMVALYAIILCIFTQMYGGYKIGYLRVAEVIYSQCLSILITNCITYLQIMLICRRLVSPVWIILLTIVQFIFTVPWGYLMNRLYFRIHPPHKMIVVYGGDSANDLLAKLRCRPDKFEICKTIRAEGDLSEAYQGIIDHSAVLLYDVDSGTRNKLLKFCFAHDIRCYITPKISDILIRGGETIDLFDTPLVLCRNEGPSAEQMFTKRAFDIFVSGVLLVLASPFMLLTALAVKLYDGGPVMYKQARLTKGGRIFKICKFRSMVVHAEKDGVARLSTENDDRITPVGKFIRKTRLDELPQLINILKGDMSIVGPRPERPEIAQQYAEVIPEFDYRLKVKGGLTGYAQIVGKYNTTPYDKLKLDLIYIENYSFLLDLKLIFRTVKIMFMKESTEGIKQGTTTAASSPSSVKKQKISAK